MRDIEVRISKETRMTYFDKYQIGNDSENLQANLVFKFVDEFVLGTARLEYIINNQKRYCILTREEETYVLPIKSVLTKKGEIIMQLVITEPSNDFKKTDDTEIIEGKTYFRLTSDGLYLVVENPVEEDLDTYYEQINIPVFKSNVFKMYCNESINSTEEQPDEFPSWIDIITTKLALIDEALIKVGNLDIDAERVEDGVEITITRKDGTQDTTKVNDGETGERGEPGPKGDKGEKGEDGQNGRDGYVQYTAGQNITIDSNNVISASSGLVDDVQINGTSILDENNIANIEIVDNVVSDDINKPLSANMGKELNDRIQNLASIGKYLAMWDCTTGLPTTNPIQMPYSYTTGDYYVISKIDETTNYMPNGSSYTGTASTTEYIGIETLAIGDFFYYDGTLWTLMKNTGKTVSFASIAGQPTDNVNLANLLDNYATKQYVEDYVNSLDGNDILY